MLHYQNRQTKRLSRLQKVLRFYSAKDKQNKVIRIKRIIAMEKE